MLESVLEALRTNSLKEKSMDLEELESAKLKYNKRKSGIGRFYILLNRMEINYINTGVYK